MKNYKHDTEGKISALPWVKLTARSLLFLSLLSSMHLWANPILKFEGVYKYQAVFFSWELDNQVTFQLKEIERSSDSVNFSNCLSFGGSNIKQMAWDKSPLQGKSFYRLKVTDSNGIINYSPVISIRIKIIIPYQQKNLSTINTDTELKASPDIKSGYDLLIYDRLGNVKSFHLISNIDYFNPAEFFYALKDGQPNIFILLKDDMVIKRQTYCIKK